LHVPKAWTTDEEDNSRLPWVVVVGVSLPTGQIAGMEGDQRLAHAQGGGMPAGSISTLIEVAPMAVVDVEEHALAFLQRNGALTQAGLG
jgi:hypothetical protein